MITTITAKSDPVRDKHACEQTEKLPPLITLILCSSCNPVILEKWDKVGLNFPHKNF